MHAFTLCPATTQRASTSSARLWRRQRSITRSTCTSAGAERAFCWVGGWEWVGGYLVGWVGGRCIHRLLWGGCWTLPQHKDPRTHARTHVDAQGRHGRVLDIEGQEPFRGPVGVRRLQLARHDGQHPGVDVVGGGMNETREVESKGRVEDRLGPSERAGRQAGIRHDTPTPLSKARSLHSYSYPYSYSSPPNSSPTLPQPTTHSLTHSLTASAPAAPPRWPAPPPSRTSPAVVACPGPCARRPGSLTTGGLGG